MSLNQPAVRTNPPVGIPRNIARLQLATLWLVGFSGAFVRFEPAPYEAVVSLAALVFAVTGLKLRPLHLPLIALLIATTIGYGIGVLPVLDEEKTLQWTVVSSFLAMTSLFFAMVMIEDTERRLKALLAGYIASAFVASLIAIVTWAHLVPGADFFILNGRALGTFKDANVFGPFLILPLVVLLARVMSGQYRRLVIDASIALTIGAALLLSFSRGAWGHFAASMLAMLFLTFITVPSHKERVRILFFAALGFAAIVLFLVALLSIESVRELFEVRASLVQSYDAGPQGRFGRYLPGFLLMLDNPWGIGPLQFTHYFPEDPHNSFLDAFAAGGWLGGAAHLTLMILTVTFGLRHVFVRTPWQRTYIAIYATVVAEVGESFIVDVQHWRHFYLLIGLIWGLMAARRITVAPREWAAYSAPLHRSVAQPG